MPRKLTLAEKQKLLRELGKTTKNLNVLFQLDITDRDIRIEFQRILGEINSL